MTASLLSRALGGPREQIVIRPTPLVASPLLSDWLGCDVWVKRDDLADGSGLGTKARRLEYVLAEARALGATVLVSAASVPSGQAAGIALHAPSFRMRAHIVYCGDEQEPPEQPTGHYLAVLLSGASITWRARAPWNDWRTYTDDVLKAEAGRGELPYMVPPGMGGYPGELGAVALGVELAADLPDDGRRTHIVLATGSGDTALGVALGLAFANRRWTVHGVVVGQASDATRLAFAQLVRSMSTRWPAATDACSLVRLSFEARGEGYGRFAHEEFRAMEVAAQSGLLVDPTYVAKAVRALALLRDAGEVGRTDRVVLVHTGSAGGALGLTPGLGAWLTQRSR